MILQADVQCPCGRKKCDEPETLKRKGQKHDRGGRARGDAGKGRSLRTVDQGLQRSYPESTGKPVKYLRIEQHHLTSD